MGPNQQSLRLPVESLGCLELHPSCCGMRVLAGTCWGSSCRTSSVLGACWASAGFWRRHRCWRGAVRAAGLDQLWLLSCLSTMSGCHPAAYASWFGIQAGSVLAFFPFCFVLSVGGKREGRQINPLPVLMLCTSPCSQCQVLNFMLRPTTGALT